MDNDTKNAWLPLLSLTIILVTCIATDIFYLKNPVFLISAVPFAAILAAAFWKVYKSPGGGNG